MWSELRISSHCLLSPLPLLNLDPKYRMTLRDVTFVQPRLSFFDKTGFYRFWNMDFKVHLKISHYSSQCMIDLWLHWGSINENVPVCNQVDRRAGCSPSKPFYTVGPFPIWESSTHKTLSLFILRKLPSIAGLQKTRERGNMAPGSIDPPRRQLFC